MLFCSLPLKTIGELLLRNLVLAMETCDTARKWVLEALPYLVLSCDLLIGLREGIEVYSIGHGKKYILQISPKVKSNL